MADRLIFNQALGNSGTLIEKDNDGQKRPPLSFLLCWLAEPIHEAFSTNFL